MNVTPLKQIRKKCIDCCCGYKPEVRNCTIQHCDLWPYRMGRRPTEEELSIYKAAKKKQ